MNYRVCRRRRRVRRPSARNEAPLDTLRSLALLAVDAVAGRTRLLPAQCREAIQPLCVSWILSSQVSQPGCCHLRLCWPPKLVAVKATSTCPDSEENEGAVEASIRSSITLRVAPVDGDYRVASMHEDSPGPPSAVSVIAADLSSASSTAQEAIHRQMIDGRCRHLARSGYLQ